MDNVIFAIILSLLLYSCRPDSKNNNPEPNGKYGDFRVIEVDHCEYIVYDYGMSDQRVFAISHKGNCKNHQSGQISKIEVKGTSNNNIEVNQNSEQNHQ